MAWDGVGWSGIESNQINKKFKRHPEGEKWSDLFRKKLLVSWDSSLPQLLLRAPHLFFRVAFSCGLALYPACVRLPQACIEGAGHTETPSFLCGGGRAPGQAWKAPGLGRRAASTAQPGLCAA